MYPVLDLARAELFYRETLGLGSSTGFVQRGWVELHLPNGGYKEPSAPDGGTY